VSAIASRQHGVISRRGLLRLGISEGQVKRLIRAGHLQRIHAGVYALGHANLSLRGRWMAAVLAGGSTAALSHHSAAALHGLLANAPPLPHVTSAVNNLRRPGIRFHTSSTLAPDERTRRDRIPSTTLPRTILDLSAHLGAFVLERVLAEAHLRGFRDTRPLELLLDRHRGRRGLAKLRGILASGHHELGRTESPLEDRFLHFVDERRLARPELNRTIRVAGRKVRPDCLWREQMIVVECDGRDVHLRRRTWEEDRRKDRKLLAAGVKPVRVTSKQLDSGADDLEADLRQLGVPLRSDGLPTSC
jgi:hypothetical protein